MYLNKIICLFMEKVDKKPFKQFLEDNLESLIVCPVSRSVIFDPVVATDGFIYEASILEQCMKHSSASPITREGLSSKTYSIPLINKIIEYGDKYKLTVCDNKYITDTSFESNFEIICSALANGTFEKIMKFNNFKLEMTDNAGKSFCELICKAKYDKNNNIVYFNCLKYIIENCSDLTVQIGSQNIMHIFSRYCIFPKLISHICNILNKKCDIESLMVPDASGYDPLEYMVYRGDKKFIDVILESNLNIKAKLPKLVNISIEHSKTNDVPLLLISLLENKNIFVNDMSPLFASIRYNKEIIVDHLLNQNVDIYATNSLKLNAVHYACQYSTCNIFKKIINKCNDNSVLQQEALDGWTLIHIACYYNTTDVIEYLLSKDILVGKPIQKFKGKECQYLPLNLIELNQKIGEKDANELISNMIQMMELQF